jgi:hypothetical protein
MECEEAKKRFKIYLPVNLVCCESCHEDENEGYGGDLWFTINEPGHSRDWNICCAIANKLQKAGLHL